MSLSLKPQAISSRLKAGHESGFIVLIAVSACVQALVGEIQSSSPPITHPPSLLLGLIRLLACLC